MRMTVHAAVKQYTYVRHCMCWMYRTFFKKYWSKIRFHWSRSFVCQSWAASVSSLPHRQYRGWIFLGFQEPCVLQQFVSCACWHPRPCLHFQHLEKPQLRFPVSNRPAHVLRSNEVRRWGGCVRLTRGQAFPPFGVLDHLRVESVDGGAVGCIHCAQFLHERAQMDGVPDPRLLVEVIAHVGHRVRFSQLERIGFLTDRAYHRAESFHPFLRRVDVRGLLELTHCRNYPLRCLRHSFWNWGQARRRSTSNRHLRFCDRSEKGLSACAESYGVEPTSDCEHAPEASGPNFRCLSIVCLSIVRLSVCQIHGNIYIYIYTHIGMYTEEVWIHVSSN